MFCFGDVHKLVQTNHNPEGCNVGAETSLCCCRFFFFWEGGGHILQICGVGVEGNELQLVGAHTYKGLHRGSSSRRKNEEEGCWVSALARMSSAFWFGPTWFQTERVLHRHSPTTPGPPLHPPRSPRPRKTSTRPGCRLRTCRRPSPASVSASETTGAKNVSEKKLIWRCITENTQ